MSWGKNATSEAVLVAMKMAEREDGVSVREIMKATGRPESTVHGLLSAATRAGRLHKAGPHNARRWFIHPEHASSYGRRTCVALQADRPFVNRTAHQMHQIAIGSLRPRASSVKRSDEPMVVTEKTKFTTGISDYTGDKRFKVREAPRVVDSRECRPWAREVGR